MSRPPASALIPATETAKPGPGGGSATAALPGVVVTPSTQALPAVPKLPRVDTPAVGGATQILDAIPIAPNTPAAPETGIPAAPPPAQRTGPAGTQILGAIPERIDPRQELTPATTTLQAVQDANQTRAMGSVEGGESPWVSSADPAWKNSEAQAAWEDALKDHSAQDAWEEALKESSTEAIWEEPTRKEWTQGAAPQEPAAASEAASDPVESEAATDPGESDDAISLAAELRSSTGSWNPPLVKESGSAQTTELISGSGETEDENG